MPDTATPREVCGRLLQGIADRRWADLPALYADDAVVTFPFTAESHRLTGRDAVRAHFAHATDLPLHIEVHDVVLHETADPEVIVAEFDYHGTVTTTGKPFRLHNIAVVRVRDGHITESRDYHDHGALAALLDRATTPAAG